MYIKNTDIYCNSCGKDVDGAEKFFSHVHEFDYPVHCEKCEKLVPVKLTPEGEKYVLEQVAIYNSGGQGRREILEGWLDHYDYIGVELREGGSIE